MLRSFVFLFIPMQISALSVTIFSVMMNHLTREFDDSWSSDSLHLTLPFIYRYTVY